MKKTSIRKLRLERETLRQLDSSALEKVAGGVSYGYWCSIQICWTDCCNTKQPTCMREL